MKRPATASILLGLIPFAASCFTVSLWDRIYPIIFGLPFNFFWAILWMILAPMCLWGALRIESRRELASQGRATDAASAGLPRKQGGAD
jgi:hypothetical protein